VDGIGSPQRAALRHVDQDVSALALDPRIIGDASRSGRFDQRSPKGSGATWPDSGWPSRQDQVR
jgi:hypothetical protein